MTDINEFPKGVLPPSQPSPYVEPLIEKIEVKKIDSPDAMGYGTDTMGAAATITLVQFAPKTNYEASIQYPELPLPDPDGQSGPQPYGMAEQKLIKQNIAKKIAESLKKEVLSPQAEQEIYDFVLLGKPLKDSKLGKTAEKIKKDVTNETRDGAHLPTSWTILSTSSKDWIPELIEPYDESKRKEINATYDTTFKTALESYASSTTPPLSAEEKGKILTAFASGKVGSDIVFHFEAVSKIATKEVQKNFGLGSTWYKGTENIDNWRPVNIGIVTPAAVNLARRDFMLENLAQYISITGESFQKVLDKLSFDDPAQLLKNDFIAIVSTALRELKALLRETNIKDAEKEKEASTLRASLTELRQKTVDESIAKRKEAAEKQAKAESTSFIMKIFGPIIAAVGTLISILSFGLASPVGVAVAAIGIALTIYSIVDSITGCTGKLAQLVNDIFENSEVLKNNESLKKFCKFLFMAAIVIAIVVIAYFGGGAIAAQAATQITREAMLTAIKQITMQLILMTIMTSNAIPEMIGAFLKDSGAMDEKSSKIFEMAMAAVVMVVGMIASAKAKPADATAVAGLGTVATIQHLGRQIITNVTELLKNIAEGIKEGVQGLITLLKNLLNQLLGLLKKIPELLKEAADKIASAAKTLLKAINDLNKEGLKAALKHFAAMMEEFAVAVKKTAGAAYDKVLEEAIAVLIKVGGKIKETAFEIVGGIKEIKDGFKSTLSLFGSMAKLRELKNIKVPTAADLEMIMALESEIGRLATKLGTGVSTTLQFTSGSIQTAEGIIQGVLGMQVYNLLMKVGEIKMAEELLQAMIEQINKLMQSLTSGIESNMESLKGLNQMLNSFWEGQSENTSKFGRSLQA